MKVFSWLFRRKGYSEILEEYQQQINSLQNNVTRLQRRQKNLFPLIHKFMLLLCLAVSLACYIWFQHWVFALLSVASHVAFTYFMRQAILLYTSRRISSFEKKIQHCKAKQQLKLDELKELTKFTQTQSLIQKYEKKPAPPPVVSPQARPQNVGGGGSSSSSSSNNNAAASNSRLLAANTQLQSHQRSSIQRSREPVPTESGTDNNNPAAESGVVIGDSVQMPSKSSGWLDKLVDLAVGQNPNNCAALVCQKCFTHNGLIMLEDWADHPIRFKCRACNFLNKPNRDEETTTTTITTTSNVASLETSSGSSPASTSSVTTDSTVNTAPPATTATLPNPAPSNASS